MTAILAERVGRTYGSGETQTGLHELSLEVEHGRVLALLGPNGAGKTTAVRGLSTLLRFDRGDARIAGHDVRSEAKQVREKIALVGQSAAVDDQLSATANLVLFARLRGMDRRTAARRAGELIDQFGLADGGARPVQGFSGGMRRRLDLAASMIIRPEVLFVDEPTTGLDPAARRDLWQALRALVREGTSILLTTQYLEEADTLADDIILLDRGRVIAQGTAGQLKSMIGPPVIQLRFDNATEAQHASSALQHIDETALIDDETQTMVTLRAGQDGTLIRSVQALEGVASPAEITMRTPSLDDVFLTLTGDRTHVAKEDL